jgi:hypothetical protein
MILLQRSKQYLQESYCNLVTIPQWTALSPLGGLISFGLRSGKWAISESVHRKQVDTAYLPHHHIPWDKGCRACRDDSTCHGLDFHRPRITPFPVLSPSMSRPTAIPFTNTGRQNSKVPQNRLEQSSAGIYTSCRFRVPQEPPNRGMQSGKKSITK